MSFQDDSVILSRLGILESKEESPHKVHSSPKKAASEKDRFVEVNIDGTADVKSDSDEEPVFDRNSLLSPNKSAKVYRKKHESYTCVYLILLLTYLAVGVGCPFSWITAQSGKEIPFSFLLENCAGLLIGCFAARLLCQRVNLIFLLFLASASLCGLSWTVSLYPNVVDARVIAALLGVCSGSILYVGLATWLIHWRGYYRKALFLYVLISLGSSFVLITQNEPRMNKESLGLVAPSVLLHKRQASFFPLSNETMLNFTSSNESTLRPKKPEVVEGIKSVETKSDKNEQMRKAAASNKTKAASTAAPSNDTTTTTTTPTPTTEGKPPSTTSTTPSSPPTLVTKRISESTTKIVRPSLQPTEFHSSITTTTISTLTAPSTLKVGEKNVRILTIVATTAVIFYLLAPVFCCIPCSVTSDLKFLRLFDPSVAGLTTGCRIRLASVQIIASFLEGLVEIVAIMFTTSEKNGHFIFWYHMIVMLSRVVVMISGTVAFSLTGCSIALLCSLLGSTLLLFGLTSSTVGFVLVSAGTGTFGLLVFFYIEVCVSPRGGTQLDYFIFSSIVGRCLCTALATIMPSVDSNQMIGIVLLGNAPLLVIFWLLVKSLRKAARLKEIMEYSSSPVMEAVGEYVSLIERTGDYDSADDQDEDDDLTG
ncbi:hypothetical protein OESDEN_04213 [Oesophagostomum dentatum]|uniref:Uncharacterized protein n=1 Tax=Oesophagostomum dentatum TaxID=61180 RepID=A0A0B1TEY2_OESDE|nr:hypothetical protein OESDEN_04213 [Oesophagostomum dentatum]